MAGGADKKRLPRRIKYYLPAVQIIQISLDGSGSFYGPWIYCWLSAETDLNVLQRRV